MRNLVLAAALITLSGSVSARSLNYTVNPSRMVSVVGVVTPAILSKSVELLALAPVTKERKEPITILINSPGGMVGPGLSFIDTINQAKARGYTINCVTAVVAASMAFQMLAHCSNIYTLPHAKLLFHPPAIVTNQPLRAGDMAYLFDQLARLEVLMAEELIKMFGFNRQLFLENFVKETMWEARELAKHTKRIKIVTDIFGIDKSLLSVSNPSLGLFDFLHEEYNHGELIYISPSLLN